jgi:hypothetical protein
MRLRVPSLPIGPVGKPHFVLPRAACLIVWLNLSKHALQLHAVLSENVVVTPTLVRRRQRTDASPSNVRIGNTSDDQIPLVNGNGVATAEPVDSCNAWTRASAPVKYLKSIRFPFNERKAAAAHHRCRTRRATIGAIGFEGRLDYGAIGTVTNLAARLCGEAGAGQILISARVASAVEVLIEAEDMGPLALKGRRVRSRSGASAR